MRLVGRVRDGVDRGTPPNRQASHNARASRLSVLSMAAEFDRGAIDARVRVRIPTRIFNRR